ncbi:MAG: polyphosphate polymerase domain-containing protein [Oscillospiraceae bacterium]|jgi:hypothetical protein|nr:polyphosphate polymerase domain-containing protein [Oscillospiraceae bacterium]
MKKAGPVSPSAGRVRGLAVEVFSRYEKKYLLDEDAYMRVLNRIREYMEPDAHGSGPGGSYEIRNIYCDTEDSALIRASLAKPYYKEKLRLRSYGAPTEGGKVYAEIKKKAGGLVNKRRIAMLPDEAERLLAGDSAGESLPAGGQVAREIACMAESWRARGSPLRPAAYIAYDREAFFGMGRHDIRVSFDAGIRARRSGLTLREDGGEPLLAPGRRVMEIKAARSIPLWLCALLSELRIYPTGFSKYGYEYARYAERAVQNARIIIPGRGGCPDADPAPAGGRFGGGDRAPDRADVRLDAQDDGARGCGAREAPVASVRRDARGAPGGDNGDNPARGEQRGAGVLARGGVFHNTLPLRARRP